MLRKKFGAAQGKNKTDITPNNQPFSRRIIKTDASRKGKMTIGKIVNVGHYTIASAAEYHMGLHLDQVDATNLGSSTLNLMPTNF